MTAKKKKKQERKREKEEIQHSPSKGWPFPEMFCKTEDPFYLTSSLTLPLYILPFDFSSSLLLSGSIKEPEDQTPTRQLFWDAVCHLLCQPAFQIKLYSLSQHLISLVHRFVFQWAEYLDSVTRSPEPKSHFISSVQSLSHVWPFVTPWNAAH